MNSVNKTLYIPLYGKALVSGRGLFIKDSSAERIWGEVNFSLFGKAKSKWLAFYMGIRAAAFDEWVMKMTAETPGAIVIQIGAGLDSRVERCNVKNMWYDVDFPGVIEERRKYFSESESYKMISADARDDEWLSGISDADTAIVVMEGVAMYFSDYDLEVLFKRLSKRFDNIKLRMDFYTPFGAKMSKRRNPINTVGVTDVWGIEYPQSLGADVFDKAIECEMTPKRFIDELRGIERFIFKTLYAGGISKRIYKVYEYEK